jgi:hypothetical protein
MLEGYCGRGREMYNVLREGKDRVGCKGGFEKIWFCGYRGWI